MHVYALTQMSVALPLLGGMLIGAGASLLYGSIGRSAGVSGILAGLIRPKPADWGWRVAFLLGLFVAGTTLQGFTRQAPTGLHANSLMLLIPAGLCAGFGARLGGGCTSGHGVCGISRLSLRSIVATVTFIAAGALTVLLTRHVIGGQS